MIEHYFPWGIAEGDAFLGRDNEIARLIHNAARGYHTLLLSPRRYGKTSLAKQAIQQTKKHWIEIDLFVTQNEASVEQKILKGVQSLISQIDSPENWLSLLINYFKKANKTWTVGVKGIQLELTPDNHKDIPDNILETLNALEYVLSKKKQSAVIFMDEFQEIANIKINIAIEGAIRHFAQSAKHVSFIFSGSSRHMLMHMFGDKSRPLYALCDTIHLQRLLPTHYQPYLNKIAKHTWHKELSQEAFEKILQLTQCHPRYTYVLCAKIWENGMRAKKLPQTQDVEQAWLQLVNERSKDVREILTQRALGQIKILSLISLGHTTELTGQAAQSKLSMSSSAISQSLRELEHDDFVEKKENGEYFLIDPLVKATLMQYGADYF